jgi:hypothetical protein
MLMIQKMLGYVDSQPEQTGTGWNYVVANVLARQEIEKRTARKRQH